MIEPVDPTQIPIDLVFDGECCCDDVACPTRELWPLPGETFPEMVARLKAKYGRAFEKGQRWCWPGETP